MMRIKKDSKGYDVLTDTIRFNGGIIKVGIGTHGWMDKNENLIKKTRYFSASFRVPSKHHMDKYVIDFFQVNAPDIKSAYKKALEEFKRTHEHTIPKEVKDKADAYYHVGKYRETRAERKERREQLAYA